MSLAWSEVATGEHVARVGPFVLTAFSAGIWRVATHVSLVAIVDGWERDGGLDAAKRAATTTLRALCADVLTQTEPSK